MKIDKILKLLDSIANFRNENGDLPFGTIDYYSISECQNELKANANLIDAAHDLLEACKQMIIIGVKCPAPKWYLDMEKAIAKAEGG